MRVYYYNKNNSPVVTVTLIIPYGAVNDPKRKAGLAHLVEHMVFRGTNNYKNAPDFIRKVYSYGGVIDAMTNYYSTIYTITLPPRYLNFAIELLFELVFNTKLNHFDEEKAIVIQENNTLLGNQTKLLIESINKIIFKNTPYQNSVGGTRKSINNITEKDARDFYDKYYKINKSNLFIIGKIKISLKNLSKYISNELTKINREKHSYSSNLKVNFQIKNINTQLENINIRSLIKFTRSNLKSKKIGTLNKNKPLGNKNGRALVASAFVFDNFDNIEEYAIAKILSIILGGNMISRMYSLIREKHQLAYSTEASVGYVKGTIVIYSLVSTNNDKKDTTKVIELMKSIYHDIFNNGVTEKEFNVSREYLYGKIKRDEQDNTILTLNLWNGYYFFKKFFDADKFREVFDSITLIKFNNQINKILIPNNVLFSIQN